VPRASWRLMPTRWRRALLGHLPARERQPACHDAGPVPANGGHDCLRWAAVGQQRGPLDEQRQRAMHHMGRSRLNLPDVPQGLVWEVGPCNSAMNQPGSGQSCSQKPLPTDTPSQQGGSRAALWWVSWVVLLWAQAVMGEMVKAAVGWQASATSPVTLRTCPIR
jgi:hypothetical protein